MACTYRLSSVIMELAVRAGMDPTRIDVGLLDQNVRGFLVTNSYPASGALLTLSQAFFFDPSNHGGRVHFVPRGGNAVMTVDEDELLEDGADVAEDRRADPISIPRVLHLNYHDVAGGLATDKQSTDRAGDRRAVGEVSLPTPVVLSADEAAQVVAVNHKVMIEDQRGDVRFSLPDRYLALSVADVLLLQRAARTDRLRIVQADLYDGYQDIRALRDRQSAYTSDVEGIPSAPQTAPPSSVVGPTLIEILDIAQLRDADDQVGFYVALSGILAAWQGATVELSYDGGQNYIDSQDWGVAAVMGETLTALDPHPQAYPDEINAVSVRVDTPNAELEDTDLTGLLNHANLAIIGDEIIQFAEVDETSPGEWDLSHLLRGRRGTAVASHAAGERFVLLELGAVPFVPAQLADIGRTLTFRATSFGTTPDNGTVTSITFAARSQIERAPAYLQARRDGDDLVLTWQGVGRLGAGATVAHGVHVAGYRVTVTDGVNSDVVDTTAQQLVHDVAGWSAPITVTLEQVNDITGAGPDIEITI